MDIKMPRKVSLALCLCLGLGIIVSRADDFWTAKKWQDWTKEECHKMLHDSPWSKKWSQSISNNGPKLPSVSGASRAGAAGDSVNEIDYYVQLRSALPVREAIVRELQIEKKYGELNADQKKSFDSQVSQILNRDYSESIVFHFVFETSTSTFSRQLAEYWQNIPPDAAPSDVYLINEKGDHIRPVRVSAPRSAGYEFEMVFPRMVNNEPVVREGDRLLRLQFPEPAIGFVSTNVSIFPTETAIFEFRVDKMVWNGKLSY
jgi:hypothetical protein